jgi:hypothetical protein
MRSRVLTNPDFLALLGGIEAEKEIREAQGPEVAESKWKEFLAGLSR